MNQLLSYPAMAYSWVRHKKYTAEYLPVLLASRVFPQAGHWAQMPEETLKAIKIEISKLMHDDVDAAAAGMYPYSVYKPEPILQHIKMSPKIWLESLLVIKRKLGGNTKKFSKEAEKYFDDVPAYFQRNYHFQRNGYLDEKSAEFYEYQVELLFFGMADAMRRLILRKMKHLLASEFDDGRNLHFCEVAAGTGRTTRFVKMAFPKARVTVTDLSHPYLKIAQQRLTEFDRLDFIQCNGADLPLKDHSVDACYSVFLFHEIPVTERKRIFQEAKRVVKPGGIVGLVDSIQLGDFPVFDPMLENFPNDFHEPFYLHYAKNSIEELAKNEGLTHLDTTRGYLSKACWFRTPK